MAGISQADSVQHCRQLGSGRSKAGEADLRR